MELIRLSDNVFFVRAPTNVGVIANERSEAVLVDTGLDRSIGKRVSKLLSQAGLIPRWIVHTHAHADHIGADRFFEEKYNCEVFYTGPEAAWAEYPSFEPFTLYGCADPPPQMKNKFLMVEESVNRVQRVTGSTLNLGGLEIRLHNLAGHSPGQVGVSYNDAVLFCGDALFPSQVIEKHPVLFHTDIGRQYNTLGRIKGLASSVNVVVAGHGGPYGAGFEPLDSILERNQGALEDCQQRVLRLWDDYPSTPLSTEEVVSGVCRQYGIEPSSIGEYFLLRSAISAYLSYLAGQGKLEPFVRGGRLCWRPMGFDGHDG